jgi:hypothetical protein
MQRVRASHCSECCEVYLGDFTMCSSKLGHQCRLSRIRIRAFGLIYVCQTLPTEGKPTKPTLATPVRATSNPKQNQRCSHQRLGIPIPPPPPDPVGTAMSSRRSFASLAEEEMSASTGVNLVRDLSKCSGEMKSPCSSVLQRIQPSRSPVEHSFTSSLSQMLSKVW